LSDALPQIEMILLDAIDTSTNARAVDMAWAEAISVSVDERGLLEPIKVRPLGDGRYALVDGGHRVEAMRMLGRLEIPARVLDLDAVDANIVAIDSNLMRNDLSALDRAVFLFERKQLWDAKYPETAHGGDRKSRKRKDKNQVANLSTWSKFSQEVSKRTGLGERTSERATELAKGLGPDIIVLLRGTRLADNQSQLQALMRIKSDDERLKAAEAIAAGDLTSVSAALKAIGAAPVSQPDEEAEYRRLLDLWNRAGRKTQRKFLAAIGLSDEAGAEDAVTARKQS
jgi:ParB family chromosome partitioning protein